MVKLHMHTHSFLSREKRRPIALADLNLLELLPSLSMCNQISCTNRTKVAFEGKKKKTLGVHWECKQFCELLQKRN